LNGDEQNFTVVREVLCNNWQSCNLAISLIFTNFGEKAQEIRLHSPDRFSPEVTRGVGTRQGVQ